MNTKIYVYKDSYIQTQKCMYANMNTYIHACLHAGIHGYIHTYIQIYIHSHVHPYALEKGRTPEKKIAHVIEHRCSRVNARESMLDHIPTYTHTCIHTYKHTYLHTYIHTYIHQYKHTYLHMDVLKIYANIHAYI